MNKIVKNSFMAVGLSILLFVIVSVSNYVISMNALRHKINNVMQSMHSTVQRNNYLSETTADMYNTILQQIKDDDHVVVDIEMNYGSSAQNVENFTIPASVDSDGKDLSKVSNYGDVKVIQVRVKVKRIVWGSLTGDSISNATDFMTGYLYKDFYFSELVPCDRYIK